MVNEPAEALPWFFTVLDREILPPGLMAVVVDEMALTIRSALLVAEKSAPVTSPPDTLTERLAGVNL
jgi:hypothetical protein